MAVPDRTLAADREPYLSVVVPVYNEAENLVELASRLAAALAAGSFKHLTQPPNYTV